jgi:hypothetical protein
LSSFRKVSDSPSLCFTAYSLQGLQNLRAGFVQEAFGSSPSRIFMRKFIEKHFSRKLGYFILALATFAEGFPAQAGM